MKYISIPEDEYNALVLKAKNNHNKLNSLHVSIYSNCGHLLNKYGYPVNYGNCDYRVNDKYTYLDDKQLEETVKEELSSLNGHLKYVQELNEIRLNSFKEEYDKLKSTWWYKLFYR